MLQDHVVMLRAAAPPPARAWTAASRKLWRKQVMRMGACRLL